MKIQLIRTGGFIPVIKAAEAEVDLSAEDLTKLIGAIQSSPSAYRIKDGNSWEIRVDERVIQIDPEKVPDEYKELFNKLKGDLRIVK